MHLISYTDDINIIGRTEIAIYELYEELKERAKAEGRKMNVEIKSGRKQENKEEEKKK